MGIASSPCGGDDKADGISLDRLGEIDFHKSLDILSGGIDSLPVTLLEFSLDSECLCHLFRHFNALGGRFKLTHALTSLAKIGVENESHSGDCLGLFP